MKIRRFLVPSSRGGNVKHVVTAVEQPGALHGTVVEPVACTCEGFIYRIGCSHMTQVKESTDGLEEILPKELS
jgi:hypothetical protein